MSSWTPKYPWFPEEGTDLSSHALPGFQAEVEESTEELFRVRVHRGYLGNTVTFRRCYWTLLTPAERTHWVLRDLKLACEQFDAAEARLRKAIAAGAIGEGS